VRPSITLRMRRGQAGIALLISIFILLLISVVAIALVVSSGTETALAGNYRASTGVYYSAIAGLEEARSRLLGKGPSAFKTTDPTTFLPAPGTPLNMGNTYYLVNPVSGESITPWDSGSVYADNQFYKEFSASGFTAPTNPSPKALSIWNRNDLGLNPGGYPGPLYKWVRINAVSEKSLGVDADGDGLADATTPLYYDGLHFSNNSSAGSQVIELTALALLPNASGQSSQKILQYIVAPTPLTLPLPAALTLSDSTGNSATFHAPASNSSYSIQGTDQDCSGNLTGARYPAIGVFMGTPTTADITSVKSGIPASPVSVQQSYVGIVTPGPDVENISSSFPTNLQNPSQLDALAQSIVQNADVVITPSPTGTPPYLGTATGANLTPLGMSASNILTVAVQGNLDISNWSNDGYGLLLVTGTFTYDPDTTWNGIILVIGQGIVAGNHAQYKQINGAMLVAKTRDGNNNVLTGPNLGGASVVFNDSMQGYGIRYSNCWIQKAEPTSDYKILSFHEIAQ
jgi:hypothetical protein